MSVRMMEEGGSYVRNYKGLPYTAISAVTAYKQLMFDPMFSLSQCSASAWGPPRVVYYILYPYRVRSSLLQTGWKGGL